MEIMKKINSRENHMLFCLFLNKYSIFDSKKNNSTITIHFYIGHFI